VHKTCILNPTKARKPGGLRNESRGLEAGAGLPFKRMTSFAFLKKINMLSDILVFEINKNKTITLLHF